MTFHLFEINLLGAIVLLCWLGALGMWRMKEPMQALHYLSLPTTGAMLLAVAVLVSQGIGQAFWKAILIALILLASNSIVTHATARAFRAKEIGHWEPRDGDPMEMIDKERKL